MNKIKIENNDMTMTVRMSDEEAEVWFGTLSRALLGDYPDIALPLDPLEEPNNESSADADSADTAAAEPDRQEYATEQSQSDFQHSGG